MLLDSQRSNKQVVLVYISSQPRHILVCSAAINQDVSVDGDRSRGALSQGVHQRGFAGSTEIFKNYSKIGKNLWYIKWSFVFD